MMDDLHKQLAERLRGLLLFSKAMVEEQRAALTILGGVPSRVTPADIELAERALAEYEKHGEQRQ